MFERERTDDCGAFDPVPGDSCYHVPSTGIYFFTTSLSIVAGGAGAGGTFFFQVADGMTFTNYGETSFTKAAGATEVMTTGSAIILNAGDIVCVFVNMVTGSMAVQTRNFTGFRVA
ncbi:Hypothetical protein UVM_LOCUS63 [uncultured virus]|nr:Hypothetical protein UVM_LOCUS63 [uncultured virus]